MALASWTQAADRGISVLDSRIEICELRQHGSTKLAHPGGPGLGGFMTLWRLVCVFVWSPDLGIRLLSLVNVHCNKVGFDVAPHLSVPLVLNACTWDLELVFTDHG